MKKIFTVAFMAAMILPFLFLPETGEAAKSASTAIKVVTDQKIEEMFERFSKLESQLQLIEKNTGNDVVTRMTALEGTFDALGGQLDEMFEDIPDIEINLDDIADYLASLSTYLNGVMNDSLIIDLEKENQGLVERAANLEAGMANLRKTIQDLNELNSHFQDVFEYIAVVPGMMNGLNGPHVIFFGANVHIRSQLKYSLKEGNGSGNLIIGYNEDLTKNPRTGDHNLIVGPGHSYNACGGFIAGLANTVKGSFASVSGGRTNTAKGEMSSVSGGAGNTASGVASSVRGGLEQEAGDEYGHVPDRQTEIAEL